MTNKERIFDYYTIVPHPTDPKVLVQRVRNAWSLPHFIPAKTHFAHAYLIKEAIEKQLGLDVSMLCCVFNDLDTESHRVNRVFTLENHSPNWQPPTGYRWIGKYELEKVALVVPEHYPILKAWFNEFKDSQIKLQRVPWARFGWYKKATAWIYQQLDRLGLTPLSPIEQLRSWSVSCVMRVNTEIGYIYFKSLPNALYKDAFFTQTLASYYPEYFPKVLAVDSDNNWILMRDFGSNVLSGITDISVWEEALRLYAKIQISEANRVDTLLAFGWPDRRLDKLPSEIEFLLSDTEALVAGDYIILEDKDIEELRALIPQFKTMAEELASYNVPQTLVHGDFWAKNIVVNNNNYIYFDWPTSAVSHPFFDIVNFLYIEKYVPDLPNVRTRLRDVYLQEWTSYEPIERLIEAFELALTLGMLYQGITYYRIVSRLEPLARWELEFAMPLCLEKLLKYRKGSLQI